MYSSIVNPLCALVLQFLIDIEKVIKMKKLFLLLLCIAVQNTIIAQKPESWYNEPNRPQIHFSPEANWMNDPNGMVYYDGEYHLFYQYYPDSTVWGPMHWGHAVSTDLTHWTHLPVALAPDKHGYIFSGSVVVDKNNTSGLQQGKDAPLIAMFTYFDPEKNKAGTNDDQTQGIAYSNDRGRTWTKYSGNPVIPNNEKIKDFRDPKMFWYEEGGYWVMVLAVGDHVRFYKSDNLKNWTLTGEFGKKEGSHGGVWECPDLFPLKVENSKTTRWVLLVSLGTGGPNGGSATQYFVGTFDGKTFVNDNKAEDILWIDYGRDNYAGVTWSNTPDNDRIFLGWMSNWQYAQMVPTSPWRSAMTLPREMELEQTPAGFRLVQEPVDQVKKLRGKPYGNLKSWVSGKDAGGLRIDGPVEIKLEIDLENNGATELGIELSNTRGEVFVLGYETATKRYFTDRTKAGKHDFSPDFAKTRHYAPRTSTDNELEWHLFIDRSSLELFADDGETLMTELFFPSEPFTSVTFFSKGGSLKIEEVEAWPLKTIWK